MSEKIKGKIIKVANRKNDLLKVVDMRKELNKAKKDIYLLKIFLSVLSGLTMVILLNVIFKVV